MLTISIIFATVMYINPRRFLYTFVLLVWAFSFLAFSSFTGILGTLSGLLMAMIYSGAMLVTIGYVCAIRPNLKTTTSENALVALLLMGVSSALLFPFTPRGVTVASCRGNDSLAFFLRTFGSPVFAVIIIMLFVTLIIVTHSHLGPKGPLRGA